MRNIAVALLVIVLAGCATTTHYGNFANNPIAFDQKIANDAVKQLVSLYPPATTRLELKQLSQDAFGVALVNGLREQGYALLEFNPKAAKALTMDKQTTVAASQPANTGLPLRYVLDQATGSNLYRLIIMVGNKSIARPYQEKKGTVVPAGYWVRKE